MAISVTLRKRYRIMESIRISLDDAKKRFDSGGDTVFVDTRAPEAWSKSNVQIPGAIRVDPHEVESNLARIPRGRPIVTYCT